MGPWAAEHITSTWVPKGPQHQEAKIPTGHNNIITWTTSRFASRVAALPGAVAEVAEAPVLPSRNSHQTYLAAVATTKNVTVKSSSER